MRNSLSIPCIQAELRQTCVCLGNTLFKRKGESCQDEVVTQELGDLRDCAGSVEGLVRVWGVNPKHVYDAIRESDDLQRFIFKSQIGLQAKLCMGGPDSG